MSAGDTLTAELYIEAKIGQDECAPVHCIIRYSNGSNPTAQYIKFSNDLYIAGNKDGSTVSFYTGIRDDTISNYPTYRIYARILGDTNAKIIMNGDGTVSSYEYAELSGTNTFNSIKIGNWLIEEDTSGNLVFKEETPT
jgi:hypothetical protein